MTNSKILSRAALPSIYTLLKQRRLPWLGRVRRMSDSRIPKVLLYCELSNGSRARGRPKLRYKDVIKNDMKQTGIDIGTWEEISFDRPNWRPTLARHLKTGEEKLRETWEKRRQKMKAITDTSKAAAFTCNNCGRTCLSRIGLHSHSRRCCSQEDTHP